MAVSSWCWYLSLVPEEWASYFMCVEASYLAFVLIGVLTLFLACSMEVEAHEIYKLRHKESTGIIGAVSHDLRTPIHVIASILDAIARTGLVAGKFDCILMVSIVNRPRYPGM
jgi:hypothetical protein